MSEIKRAIQTLENCRDVAAVRLKNNEAKRTAIYVDIDTLSDFNQAISALEKQIPKNVEKIVKDEQEASGYSETCPTCHAFVYDECCSNCGQALDWSGENEQ